VSQDIFAMFVLVGLLLQLLLQHAAGNVVVFLVDDLGYGDLGCYGNESVDSMSIDRLAAGGVLFSQWLSASSICTPSRGALLTGRLPVRLGLASSDYKRRVFHPTSPTGLPHSEVTLAEVLRDRGGYMTHISGKWHLGLGDYLPTSHGFDHFYGLGLTNVQSCMKDKSIYRQRYLWLFILENTYAVWLSLLLIVCGAWYFGYGFWLWFVCVVLLFCGVVHFVGTYTFMNRGNCVLYRDRDIVQQPVELYNLTQRLTYDAVGFIESAVAKGSPFFLFMSYAKVHTALFNIESFGEINYLNNIRELDWSVGKILHTLEKVGVENDTLVWFTSDNGPFKERFEEGGSSGPLRGAKGQIYEGGIRVPGIVRYPSRFSGGVARRQPVSSMDIFPTTLDLLNLTYEQSNLDGKSLADMLLGRQVESPHKVMFHYCGEELAAVRFDGRYKIVFATPNWELGLECCPSASMCGCSGAAVTKHDPPLVFDLDNDIAEANPLTLESALAKRLNDALDRHRESFIRFPNQPNQMHLMQNPWLLPCCDPPKCACNKE